MEFRAPKLIDLVRKSLARIESSVDPQKDSKAVDGLKSSVLRTMAECELRTSTAPQADASGSSTVHVPGEAHWVPASSIPADSIPGRSIARDSLEARSTQSTSSDSSREYQQQAEDRAA